MDHEIFNARSNHSVIAKSVRDEDGMYSFVIVLTQALYESGNEWVDIRVS